MIKLNFWSSKSITFLATFTVLHFESVCLSLNTETEENLEKIKWKSNREKSNLSVNKLRPFPEKKHVQWLT